MTQRIARLQPAPPYHYFNPGMDARRALQRRVSLLAGVAHLRLGELDRAVTHLALARDTSIRADVRERYVAKLENLRALGAAGVPRPR